jgi:hypothetical protein
MRTCYECRTDRVVSRATLPPSLKNFHCAIKSGHDICRLQGAKAGIDRFFWGLYKGADQIGEQRRFPSASSHELLRGQWRPPAQAG